VFCHAHTCKSSAAAGEWKNLPKKKEKVRERENQGSTAMHEGKEKKEKKRKKSATSRFA
jgi:hypothetical protein